MLKKILSFFIQAPKAPSEPELPPKKINVLITSGGTKIQIDRVRSITNMSKGTFGAKIADNFIYGDIENYNPHIRFLRAKESKEPVLFARAELSCDILNYVTFDDYSKELDKELARKPDIVILAAAVSDYGVENFVDGKIRTSDDELVIRLKPLPKLIATVRDKVGPKTVICGFKLLVDSTGEELKAACEKSLIGNKLDVIIGNDLRDIKNSNHILTVGKMVDGKAVFSKHEAKDCDLSAVVCDACIEALERNH